MNSINLTKVGGAILGLVMLAGIVVMASSTAQAQWQQWPQWPSNGRNRDDRWGRGGNGRGFQMARERGYQDGLSTGQSDSQRGQNFNPQRSHYYRSGTDGYERNYGDRDAYRQVFREAFLRGYEDGFRKYRGNNRGNNRGNDGRWRNGRWFPW